MATPKSWTAYDVSLGKFSVSQIGTMLYIERRYQFVDDGDVIITDIAGGRLTAEVEWSTVPPDIQSALQTINTWTYNQILTQEGME